MTEIQNLAVWADIPDRLAGIVAYRALKAGVSLRTLRSSDKRLELVKVRRAIAYEARQSGYSLWQIGRALNRDSSTVLHSIRMQSEHHGSERR
jgi:chromosomal replication initiation ATPase DnaA